MHEPVEKTSAQFFRPWKQEDNEYERSAFSPIEPRRACSVSSDDTSSNSSGGSSSLAMLRNFVDDRATIDEQLQSVWTYNAPTACYQMPAAHNSGLLDANWYTRYQTVQEAVNRLNQQEAVAKQIKKSRPKKFKCQMCFVAFSNNGQLKGHLRIHTGERPFKCDNEGCGKSFTRNEELTRHKRIHTGIRPYVCPVCRKGFGRKDHLKKHSKTHDARHVVPGYHQQLAMAAVAHAYTVGYHHPTALPYALV